MLANMNSVYGCILITSDKKVLIIKGRKTGKWSFPKGHANTGETQLQCANRETYEETGIQITNLFQKIIHLTTGTYFMYSHLEQDCKPIDVKEVMETAWVPLEKLKTMNVNVDINAFIRSHSYLLETKAQRNIPKTPIRKYYH
jgi:8-oxo-dGTP pyrophosphatase MutT (NUDIX family)